MPNDTSLSAPESSWKNGRSMIVDTENMGLDTLVVLLCAILAEIW